LVAVGVQQQVEVEAVQRTGLLNGVTVLGGRGAAIGV
jgi:hypothetical protein